MSKRLWLLGVGGLVLVGLLMACGSNYNSSSDGLVLVGSQGSGVIETFGFNLNSGHARAIANSPNDTANQTCVLNGIPSSIVVDKSGSYAYAIINANTACDTQNNISKTGIAAFKIGSDGSITATDNLVQLKSPTVTIQGTTNTEQVPVVPGTMKMDAAGKFLFVADRATTDAPPPPQPQPPPDQIHNVPGAVSVFSIGSGGSLTEVSGSPFFVQPAPVTTVAFASYDFIDVATTATVFPTNSINGVQNAVCSDVGNAAPTSEYLYALDTLGNQVFEFQVDTSTGALTSITNTSGSGQPPTVTTDAVPVGVAVDPCDRFVYVSNSQSNKVSGYAICNLLATQPGGCSQSQNTLPPAGLLQIAGSPVSLPGSANGAGAIVVDPYGKFVYVLGTNSNTISMLKISPISGSLTPNASTTATGLKPTSIAIRSDDTWMFVTNYNSASVSQYAITPATGLLNAQQAIGTDNYPWGVAVK